MTKLSRIFFLGMFISFLGSLPLGTLIVAAMQISISDGIQPAILFALGVLTAEMIYVRLSLVAMDWLRRQHRLLKWLEWITLAIVVALAASSFYAALNPSVEENIILSSSLNRYLLGLGMSAVNPAQIPFWFGWSTLLFSKKILQPKGSHYNVYIVGIGLGTLIGHCLFIFGGRLIADRITSNQNILNWIIGGIFAVTAIIQFVKIMLHKDPQHDLDHPEDMRKKFEEQLEGVQKSEV